MRRNIKRVQGTILVVDDQEIGRISLEGLLLPLGYDVHFASDGAEALALLDESNVDVVLLDVMMPGMDGYEVCRRIRATPRWQDLPVILVTALDDQDSRIRGLESGADDFISKPLDWAELRARVQTTVKLGRTRRQLQERAKFEWAVSHSRDGFLWLDQDGVYQFANATARRWLELASDDALPALPKEPWLAHISQLFLVQPEVSWQELREAGEAFQLTFVRPETSQRPALWLQVQASPLPNPEGERRGWMVHLQDVTALQMHMQQVMTVLHLMSHKLNTPLSLIKGPLDMLGEDQIDFDSPAWFELREILSAGVERLRRDISQVLQLAELLDSPEVNAPGNALDAEHVAACLRHVCRELDFSCELCSLGYQASHAIDLNPAVLELVLYQLLDNAVKFHPQNSPRMEILVYDVADEESVRLEVKDDGPGIPPELHDHVWRPFYQIDRIGAGQVPGLGIGLSLVANYIWSAGGKCWIRNSGAGNTCVCLQVPAAVAEDRVDSRHVATRDIV